MFKRRLSVVNLALVFAALTMACTRNTYAYLDPSIGSYFFQMAAASLLGGLFVVKSFWTQIKDFIQDKVLRRTATKQSS